MGVVYASALRTTRMNDVKTAIDAGSGAGTLEIGTTAMGTVLAIITLTDPCGSVSGDVLTFTMPHSDTSADATGTAAAARIKDSDGNVIVSGLTVGTSGTNIVLDDVALVATQTVTLTAGTLTHNTSGT
jgi:hypothetical protein